jgi:hypothetical protein
MILNPRKEQIKPGLCCAPPGYVDPLYYPKMAVPPQADPVKFFISANGMFILDSI